MQKKQNKKTPKNPPKKTPRDIGNLLLQRTLDMSDHIQQKQHDNFVASMDL